MRLISLVLAVCLASPFAALARTATDWQRVLSLPSGSSVVVKTQNGRTYHGRLIGSTADSIALDSSERGFPGRKTVRREFPKGDVSQVRRYNRAASIGLGAGIGAAIGAGIGTAIDNSSSKEDGRLGTVVFVVLGTLIGAGIASNATLIQGEVVYRAP